MIRTPSATEFKQYLERNHNAQFDELVRAAKAYRGRGWGATFYGLGSYVDKKIIPEPEVAKWTKWLELAEVEETALQNRNRVTTYSRQDFGATMAGGEFDRMLEEVGSQPDANREKAGLGGWHSARIPGDPGPTPVKPNAKPPQVRTASDSNLTRNWPGQLPENVDRRFLRSWVRAVPAAFADQVRNTRPACSGRS